ncbi:MAG: hypothetical protein OMM_03159 [Candidatus Magnetoglobus multicellularis str. Araruama]|uniref:Secreted protein n=1 Tax=Candidatus Magnetoglobus multicellularis str. Araruama TaxID=890399 RepID=A0A1V1P6U3_9BACT|nr:MAG: hypothetical protein OMM_03159 [Candidatus Magnetoglobus multicellularis str. Araruama]
MVKFYLLLGISCMISAGQSVLAQESHCQHLWLDPISMYAAPAQNITISLYYDVTSNDNTLLGMGFRLFFNSDLLMFQKASQFFNTFKAPLVQEDHEDLDADPDTDLYVIIAWFEWNGRWPGERLPCFLGNIDFMVLPDAPTDVTTLNVNITATHPGYKGCLHSSKIYIKSIK